MSAVEVILPKVDMDMESGVIMVWKVGEGDIVNQGDIIFEMETSKSNMEVEAPGTGIIYDLASITGEEIPVGTTVAWIYPSADDAAASRTTVGAAETMRKQSAATPPAPHGDDRDGTRACP